MIFFSIKAEKNIVGQHTTTLLILLTFKYATFIDKSSIVTRAKACAFKLSHKQTIS